MKTIKLITSKIVLTLIFVWVGMASFAQDNSGAYISGDTTVQVSSITNHSFMDPNRYFQISDLHWEVNYIDGEQEVAAVAIMESFENPEKVTMLWHHSDTDRQVQIKAIFIDTHWGEIELSKIINVIGNQNGEENFNVSISGATTVIAASTENYNFEEGSFHTRTISWEAIYKDNGLPAAEIAYQDEWGDSVWVTWYDSDRDREAQLKTTITQVDGSVFFIYQDVLIKKTDDFEQVSAPIIIGPKTAIAGKREDYRLTNIEADDISNLEWVVEYEDTSIVTDENFVGNSSSDELSIDIVWYLLETIEEAKIKAIITKTNGEIFTVSLNVIIILEQYSNNDLAISGLSAVSSLSINAYSITNLENDDVENVDWEVNLINSQENPGTFIPSTTDPNRLVASWNDMGTDTEAEIKATITKTNGEIVILSTPVMVLTQNEPTTTAISGPGAIDVLNTEQHLIANTVREYSVENLDQSEINNIEWSVNYTNDGFPAGLTQKTGANTVEISWLYSHFNREAEIKALLTKNDGSAINLSKTVKVFRHSNQNIWISGLDTIESSNRDEYRLWNIDPSYIETVDWEVIYPDGVERNHSTIGSINNVYDPLTIGWTTDNCDKDIEIKVTITETNGNTFTITKPISVLKTNPFYLTNDAPVITKISSVYINSKIDLNLNYDFEWVLPDSAELVTTKEKGSEALIIFNEYGDHEVKVLAHSDGYENCSPYWITSMINVPEPTSLNSNIIGKTVVDRYTDTKYTIKTKNEAPVTTTWTITGGQIMAQDDMGVVVRWTHSDGGTLAAHVDFLGNGLYFDTSLDVSIAPTKTNPYSGTTSSNENAITTTLYQEAFTNVTIATPGIQNITYLDALGRPKQQIAVNAGGNKEHTITHSEYDVFGRPEKTFLPYATTSSTTDFRTQATAEAFGFYDTQKYENTTNPYSEVLYDGSAINQVIKEAAPGHDWSANILNEHTIRTTYDLVSSTDDIGYIAEDGRVTIRKKTTKNENWTYGDYKNNTTEEFIDYQGRTVVKRTYTGGIAHDTKYLYDDHENLTTVIPPESASEFRYYYRYDSYNRVIEKKIPGKDWEYVVYNKQGLPVMTQDPNQRTNNQWLFTKYDRFGRVAYTGVITNTGDRAYMQSVVDQSAVHFVTKTEDPIIVAGTEIYYTNDAKPVGITEIHTLNYYDDYMFDWNYGSGLTTDPAMVTAYDQEISNNPKGLATGSKIRVLGTDQWILSYTVYDKKARPIYNATFNEYLETTDILQSKLDFVGKIEETTAVHHKTGHEEITTIDRFTYDHMGRLRTQIQQINDQTPELIASNTYDELGQLVTKGVGGQVAAGSSTALSPLQNIDYTYTIRGWLKGINDIDTLGDDLFAFGIQYNTPTEHLDATPLYNGNISETLWKTANDHQKRAYGYQYDALDRITKATDNSADQRYSLYNITYDKNGNIQQLTRNGHVNNEATQFGLMDNIDFYYQGNQLYAADEDTDAPNIGFADYNGTADGTQEYFYDLNGNMIIDKNKGISNIAYNHLNLPTRITLTEGEDTGEIYYIYDATGTKLKKMVYSDSGHETETAYAGNYVYTDNQLQFFNQPEGYVAPQYDGSYQYTYQYKDHLGNIRLSYKKANTDPITSTFDTGVDDWQSYGSLSALSHVDGRLRVDLFSTNSGTSKIYTVPTGKKVFLVDFETEAVGTFGVFLTLVEYDANNNLTRSYIRDVTEGTYRASFTLQESTVKVAFYIRNDTYTAIEVPHLFIDNVDAYFLDTQEELDSPLTIVEEKNYYPFGLEHKGYNNTIVGQEHPYKYNGKEHNQELGLDWYDFGARNYDPALGRWMNLDPLAEQMRRHSPYNYAFDNPIYFIDPDGMKPFGNGEQPEEVYKGPSVAVGDNVVNELDEVIIGTIVTGKAQGAHVEPTEGGKRFNGFKLEGEIRAQDTKTRGSISGFSGGYEDTSEGNMMSGNASAFGAEAEFSSKADGITETKGKGSLFKAEASGAFGVYSPEINGGKEGVAVKASVGAFLAKGEISTSVTIPKALPIVGGYKIGITRGASFASAHIGGGAEASVIDGAAKLSASFNVGLGVGFKYGFSVSTSNLK
ncbi:DUF6443 domain-containing protein [Aquimarina pacifica]|uniref:DUF6443 domain-containing protein n=1 Tax=Aquimarina pacifica TaxID=1296415 RepID=UPI001F4C7E60|nr:DUF6443 domain-containing protein [Aquimarina pacifica]